MEEESLKYYLLSEPSTNWFEFAKKIQTAGLKKRLIPSKIIDFSVIDKGLKYLILINIEKESQGSWQEALKNILTFSWVNNSKIDFFKNKLC